MARLRSFKFIPMLVAVAFASVTLLIATQPANAELALLRVKRYWWFSLTDTWTDGLIHPTDGGKAGMGSLPPAEVYVAEVTPNPSFVMPKYLIKNSIGNLIAKLIRMPRGNGFTS